MFLPRRMILRFFRRKASHRFSFARPVHCAYAFAMSRYLQTLSAVLLLMLVPVLGQAGILQCLCSGQFTSTAFVAEGYEACCCEQEKDCSECSHDDEQPAPCDEGSCWVLVTIDAVEASPIHFPSLTPLAVCASRFALPARLFPPVSAQRALPQHRLPDRNQAPLTVLFSSFLI
jgi:hypothetical protein